MTMTKTDYEKILSYYKIPFDNLNPRELKQTAEDILATKLCKCIKAVEKKVGTQNAIALCTTSVFGKKGLRSPLSSVVEISSAVFKQSKAEWSARKAITWVC